MNTAFDKPLTDPGAMAGQAAVGGWTVRMIPKLAYRNLVHDRISFLVTIVGILFSVVLVAVQSGLYLGSERNIAAMLDRAAPDLWITPIGTKSFDDPMPLQGRERSAALSTPGVASAADLVASFANWRKPAGGTTTVLMIGSDWSQGGLAPWNIVEGSLSALAAPGAVAVDRSYFEDLGVKQIGDTAEINGTKVTVAAITNGIRSFTTLPYVFTNLPRARYMAGHAPNQANYTLVKLAPGADLATVRSILQSRLGDVEVLAHEVFRSRSLDYWLFATGAGSALIAGALLGLIVGIVIVAQTLYASTKDHLHEFATLRALGASASYIHWVILIQALLSAVIGYVLGLVLSLGLVMAAKDTSLALVMTPHLAALLFVLTIVMCSVAAISAIVKVTRIDPGAVFSR